jgi:integrase
MRGLGTLYKQRGSRFWWMQYFNRGRRFRESTGCELHRDAQRVLKQKLLAIGDGRTDATTPTVAGLYAAIERDYATNGRKSLHHLQGLWTNHLQAFFGSAALAASDLTSSQILSYIEQRRAAGAANASINRELAALKRMYKLAVKEQRVKAVPYIGLLEERNVRKGFLRDAEYDALARETAKAGLWLRAMFEVAYTFGWRKSELTGMRVSQVDLMEATIELNPGETKNDQGRLVVMTARIRELLSECIAGKGSADLVFTRGTGKPAGNFRKAWARACHDAGVDGLLFHDLRRTAVRNMRRRGIPEKVAMRISGHRTRAVFERYNIVDAADLKLAVAALERGAGTPAAVAAD